jgi:hypothetical protein
MGAGATGHVVVLELMWALVVGAGATRHAAAPELPCPIFRVPAVAPRPTPANILPRGTFLSFVCWNSEEVV